MVRSDFLCQRRSSIHFNSVSGDPIIENRACLFALSQFDIYLLLCFLLYIKQSSIYKANTTAVTDTFLGFEYKGEYFLSSTLVREGQTFPKLKFSALFISL